MDKLSLAEFAIKELSVPTLCLIVFSIIIYYVMKKVVPHILEQQKKRDESQQQYYADRQKQYNDQMEVLIQVAEQGNQALGQSIAALNQSTAVIARNNEIIGQCVTMNDKVVTALEINTKSLEGVITKFDYSDRRTEHMNKDLLTMVEQNKQILQLIK